MSTERKWAGVNVCFALQVVALSGMTTSPLRTPPLSLSQPVTSSRPSRLLQRPLITSPRPLLAAHWSRAGRPPPATRASPSLLPASPASPSHTSPTLTWSKEASDAHATRALHACTRTLYLPVSVGSWLSKCKRALTCVSGHAGCQPISISPLSVALFPISS